ncbi:MAG TPA: hypothetical protein VH880_05440 [Anaeromyxobacteraceae bacterium]
MRSPLGLACLAAALAGCTLTLDPVPPPSQAACTPPSCAQRACGYAECGVTCGAASGCVPTHRVEGSITAGGGQAAAAGGHAAIGAFVLSAGQAAAGGHAISRGRVSP